MGSSAYPGKPLVQRDLELFEVFLREGFTSVAEQERTRELLGIHVPEGPFRWCSGECLPTAVCTLPGWAIVP